MPLQKASRRENLLKMAIFGAPNSGKTFSGIQFADLLVGENKGVIDTETGASKIYCGGKPFEFFIEEIPLYEPEVFRDSNKTYESLVKPYEDALTLFEKEGLKAVVIDSFSLFWRVFNMTHPRLVQVHPTKNDKAAWGDLKKHHLRFIRRLLASPMHVIVTCRQKQKDEKNPNSEPVPETARDTIWEFNTVLTMEHGTAQVLKGPDEMKGGRKFKHPGKKELDQIMTWLNGGAIDDIKTLPNSPGRNATA